MPKVKTLTLLELSENEVFHLKSLLENIPHSSMVEDYGVVEGGAAAITEIWDVLPNFEVEGEGEGEGEVE